MNLADAQIAVLAENQYQELELWYPLLRLREEGANVVVVGPVAGQPYASKLGYPVVPDVSINDVDASDFDAVVIPGGFAPEGMRRHKPMIDFVRNVHDQGALVAAICHAGWVLASAGIACRVEGSPRLPVAVQATLGWVVREGTTNVLRHSQAQECVITLSAGAAAVTLTMDNDGTPSGAAPARPGTGLTGLTERITALGGTVTAGCSPGDRFRLEATVPAAPVQAAGRPAGRETGQETGRDAGRKVGSP